MKQSSLRKDRKVKTKPYSIKKNEKTEAPPVTLPEEKVINNPATQLKIDLIEEKKKEVEETERVKQLSSQMGAYFRELADSIKELTEGTQQVGNTLENWDLAFGIMGETNIQDQSNWVRFPKS